MDGVTYSTLMNLYVDSGDTKGAERILDRMAQAKPPVRPDEVTYNTLMILYASKKSVRKCEALLTCAVEAGVKISEAMISTVARVHLTKGFVKKSVRFWHARYVF